MNAIPVLFALAGIAALTVIVIEIRRAFHPGSAVRELARRVRGEPMVITYRIKDGSE